MSSKGWKSYKLIELGKLARGKSKHRPRGADFLYGGKYPFIQTGDIKAANHKITTYTQTYSEAGLAQSKIWPEGTIAITIAANIAETGILTFPACFPDSVLGFIADPGKCDVDFVEYLLQYYKRQIQSHAIGSVQDNINLGTFENVAFLIPPLPTQRRIADILSSLDDKIELNRQTNATLEAITQAIFKEWFVDFNFPGATGEMEESVLGMIPKGWRVGTLGDLYKTTSGGTPSRNRSEYYENGIHQWVKSKELNGTFIINTEERITEDALKSSSAKLLPKHSVLIAMYGATVGQVGIISNNASTNQAVCAFIPNQNYPFSFVYQFLKNNKENITSRAVGSAQQNISQELLRNLELIIPENSVLQNYHIFVETILLEIEENICQSATLAILRDTLLPKLMAGEIEL